MLVGDAESNLLLDGNALAGDRFRAGAIFAGHFHIISVLGRGGMGEVYRGRDANLKRDVALKILPGAFALDRDRLARFKREAHVLASLNHPNIGAIYGLEESSGMQALVLELAEGPTLADRIKQGPIPVNEALPIAKQIAEALEAAHEQGVIHRDLKPANIKLRSDGVVKVLDFGLAKALDPATPSLQATETGIVLGTPAYMSPEQARGNPIDKRTDIWAFGCVLFEMLAGRRAIEGENVSDTLVNVLKNEPDWRVLPPSIPPRIRTLVQRCLNKDRGRRVTDAGTIAYVLEEALSPVADTGAIAPASTRTVGIRRWLLPVFLTALVAMLVAGVALWTRRPARPSPVITRFALSTFDGQLAILSRPQIAVSPDGSRLVYYSNGRTFIRDLSEFGARSIHAPGTFVGQTAFSPDGLSLAFWLPDDSTIKRMGLGGSLPETVCRSANVFGMTWDRSGIIIGQGAKGILRCRLDGSTPEQIASVAEGEEADGPQVLPDGDTLLFSVARIADGLARWDSARIVVESLKSHERRTVVEGGSAARYLPSGHLVYARGGVVFAVPFAVDQRRVTGRPVAVIEGVRRTAGLTTGGAQFAVSNTGHLFYIPGPTVVNTSERIIALADRAGVVSRLTVSPGPYVHARVSPDGTRLAVGSDDGKDAAVWICRLDGTGALQRLTLEGRNRFPIWSPDGARVAFQSDRGGDHAIYVQRVDGRGRAERLTKAGNGESQMPESWSPDGRYILVSVAKGSDFSLWTFSVADGALTPFGLISQQPTSAVFSPDGRWIAYSRGGGLGLISPDNGVFVQPFPATGAIYQAPKIQIDFHPVWSRDGKELIYIPSAASGQLATVKVTTETGLTFGAPVTSPARVTGARISTQPRAYDILPDGRFIGLMDASEPPENAAFEIRVVLNWFEELKARVKPAQ
ncbi:MAG TPA: protein kinase [Bryobacteraceae bacterium]